MSEFKDGFFAFWGWLDFSLYQFAGWLVAITVFNLLTEIGKLIVKKLIVLP